MWGDFISLPTQRPFVRRTHLTLPRFVPTIVNTKAMRGRTDQNFQSHDAQSFSA
jgi:hypothetical protein